VSGAAEIFDAFAFLATLREAAEASAPARAPVASPREPELSNRSSLRPEPGGVEPAPRNGFRSFRRISASEVALSAPEPFGPPLPWRRLPFGPERGAASALARQEPGACRTCAGRRWWRHPDGTPCCVVCHPSPHLLPTAMRHYP